MTPLAKDRPHPATSSMRTALRSHACPVRAGRTAQARTPLVTESCRIRPQRRSCTVILPWSPPRLGNP